MLSPAIEAARKRKLHLRHVLVAALLPTFLFVLWNDESYLINHSDPKWASFYPVRWLLLPHAASGLAALLIGPFQLSSRFRQRHLYVHRILGRVYLACIVFSATGALFLSAIHEKQIPDREWAFALSIAWLITAGMAFAAVRNGNIDAHRQWTVRNYAFTTVFVTARVLNAMRLPDVYGLAAGWILLLATLLLTEVGLSWGSVFTKRMRYRPQAGQM